MRLKSDILIFFEPKKIEIGEVDQKLFYFENGNKQGKNSLYFAVSR